MRRFPNCRLLVASVLLTLNCLAFAVYSTPTWAADTPPAFTIDLNVELINGIEFGKVGDRVLKLDLARPKSSKAGDPIPAVIWIHGGSWKAGDRACPQFLNVMAKNGFLTVSIDYRLSQEAIFPAQIEDCKCAVRWLRAHAKEYNIDPDHIGAIGGSAGGHLAALLGTSHGAKDLEGNGGWQDYSSKVQAVFDLCGPTDLLKAAEHFIENGISEAELEVKLYSPTSAVWQLMDGSMKEKRELYRKANPIIYITRDDPPFLIRHGDRDSVVPIQQSEILHKALKKKGIESTLCIVKDADHDVGGEIAENMAIEFFSKHLKKR